MASERTKRTGGTGNRSPDDKFREPSPPSHVHESVAARRAAGRQSGASSSESRHEKPSAAKNGRPPQRWRIRVVRIDASKYPQFARDKDHPFASMDLETRIEEIDAFFARLRARARSQESLKPASGGLSAAA